MRNDNAKWHPASGLDRPVLSAPGCEIQIVQPELQTLISGPYNDALKLAGISTATGWPERAKGECYAVRLRRDRILVVNGPELADGWHDVEGLAVSDMTDGYAILELSGANAMSVLRRGTEISLNEPSASVTRGFSGYGTLIYRFEQIDRFRVHCPRGFLEGLWSLMQSYAEQFNA